MFTLKDIELNIAKERTPNILVYTQHMVIILNRQIALVDMDVGLWDI